VTKGVSRDFIRQGHCVLFYYFRVLAAAVMTPKPFAKICVRKPMNARAATIVAQINVVPMTTVVPTVVSARTKMPSSSTSKGVWISHAMNLLLA
jgi:hypothetical protein